jgi:glyoxylate utilization-related uncharacterized protein
MDMSAKRHRTPSVDGDSGARILQFPVVPDRRGNLTFIEGNEHIPFAIERVFYLYDVPGGESRAGHALHDVEQVLVAMSGSFDVVLDDGATRQLVTLNRSYVGLFIPSLVWREIENFSSGAVCLVLASKRYDENGYYRDYDDFLGAARGNRAE